MSSFGPIAANARRASFSRPTRASACAATACVSPEVQRGGPPYIPNEYSQQMLEPLFLPRATSARARAVAFRRSPALVSALTRPKLASGWNWYPWEP